MNKFLVTLLVSAIVCGCQSELIIGEYEATKPGKMKRTLLSINDYQGIANSVILKLNPDQRYIYETCGIITEGTYAIETDRLVLSHDKIFKRISKTKQEQVTFEMFPFYQEKLRFEIKHRTLIGSIDRVFYQLKAK